MTGKKESHLIINDVYIPISITESKKSRNIRLVVDEKGVRITKPQGVKISEVERVLEEKQSWIYKHYKNFLDRKSNKVQRQWETGENALYLGERYVINVVNHNKNQVSVGFDGIVFEICIDGKMAPEERKIIIESTFKKWYKQAASKVIHERLEHCCKMTGMRFHEVRFKEQKTRWGSCSKKGNLNFNWRLVMAPLEIIDYVVLHEVCHLKHLDHSKDFWGMVARYMPEYEKARAWLKKNGITLSVT